MIDTKTASVILKVVAVVFAAIGTWALVAPELLAQQIEITLNSVSSRNEFRANYGGMFFLMGIYFYMTAGRKESQRTNFLLLSLMMLGLVEGRLLAIMLDGLPNAFVLAMLTLEAVSALAMFLLYRATAPVTGKTKDRTVTA